MLTQILYLFVVVFIIWKLRDKASDLYPTFYAWIINYFCVESKKSKLISAKKDWMFSNMKELLESMPGPVLEIGVGSGANFKYYPTNTQLIVVEPNEKFKSYVDAALKDAPHVVISDFIIGSAADLYSIPDNTVSCVVCTMALCSMTQARKCLQEIHRVLKKNGTYYFMEHIEEEKKSAMRTVQQLIYWPWKYIVSCDCMMKIDELVGEVGFASVTKESFYVKGPFYLIQVNKFITGYAVK